MAVLQWRHVPLRKWARAGTSLEDLVRRPCRDTSDKCVIHADAPNVTPTSSIEAGGLAKWRRHPT